MFNATEEKQNNSKGTHPCALLIKEEQTRYFESLFAETIMTHKNLTPSVIKVSNKIMDLLKNNLDDNVIQQQTKTKINEELYGSDMFGSTKNKGLPIKEHLIELLSNPSTPLPTVMHIHGLFIHRLFDCLESKTNKDNISTLKENKKWLVKKIFDIPAFKDRGRTQSAKAAKPSVATGITQSTYFTKKLQTADTHIRGGDLYRPAQGSTELIHKKQQNGIFVAGKSGHAGSLILGCQLYGTLTKEEQQQYFLAIFAYLTQAGCHSYHESMEIANTVGISVSSPRYDHILPHSLIRSAPYQALQKQFPNHLPQQHQ